MRCSRAARARRNTPQRGAATEGSRGSRPGTSRNYASPSLTWSPTLLRVFGAPPFPPSPYAAHDNVHLPLRSRESLLAL